MLYFWITKQSCSLELIAACMNCVVVGHIMLLSLFFSLLLFYTDHLRFLPFLFAANLVKYNTVFKIVLHYASTEYDWYNMCLNLTLESIT